MALEYCVLASGSAGNSLWIRGGGVELLIDCGLPAATLDARLSEIGRSLAGISAVVCTHGHGDHVAAAGTLLRRHGLELFATAPTIAAVQGKLPPERVREIPTRTRFRLGGLEVRTAPTPHDADGSICVVVEGEGASVGLATDFGHVNEAVIEHLTGVDGLVLESNHDEELLRDGPYPAHLKRRIASSLGHLSNRQSARLLERIASTQLQHLTLAHLSERNNEPSLARAVAEETLAKARMRPVLEVATQRRVGAMVRLGPRRGAQLALALA